MRLFIFQSRTRPDLRAFTGDTAGQKLPKSHGPWTATGIVGVTAAPPHKMSREAIEQAIAKQGYQLWRMTKKTEADA